MKYMDINEHDTACHLIRKSRLTLNYIYYLDMAFRSAIFIPHSYTLRIAALQKYILNRSVQYYYQN